MSGASGAAALVGNGVALVRERALAGEVQRTLERLYRIDRVADVEAFVAEASLGEREALLVREAEDGALELSLRVPSLAASAEDSTPPLDDFCQIIEGVSHFVYLTHHASSGRSITQLELELQAEVDKFVLLVGASASPAAASGTLRQRLFSDVSFVHAQGTEEGGRYRLANAAADRFAARLERKYLRRNLFAELHGELRRFFRMGQEDKLRAAGLL